MFSTSAWYGQIIERVIPQLYNVASLKLEIQLCMVISHWLDWLDILRVKGKFKIFKFSGYAPGLELTLLRLSVNRGSLPDPIDQRGNFNKLTE